MTGRGRRGWLGVDGVGKGGWGVDDGGWEGDGEWVVVVVRW